MIKKALKSSIWIAVGGTIGGCILPRIYLSNTYNKDWPPIWKHAIYALLVGYATSFVVYLAAEWITLKIKK